MLVDSPWAYGASPEDDRARDAGHLRSVLEDPDSAILVVESAGVMVAAAGVVREARLKRRHIATMWGVYVAPCERGKGLGRVVVAAAIQTARGMDGVRWVHLSVSQNAPVARKLYESMGFRAWGTEPDALRVGGSSWAEAHMALELT